MDAAIPPDRVVIVRDPSVIGDDGIDGTKVADMLRRAMSELTPAGNEAAAWQGLFSSSDRVAIKANCLAGPMLSTHADVLAAVHAGLLSGDAPAEVMVYERLLPELEAAGVGMVTEGLLAGGSDDFGYDEDITVFGETGTRFSKIVSEWATAIINVPVLKDHDMCGLSAALKNHFGSINNPNKLHTNHCSPHVADVNACPVIRDKHRLVACDALQVCYDGGPGYKPATTVPYGALIVATNPVAADAVGLRIIEDLRAENGLTPLSETDRYPTYLRVAADAQHALGTADLDMLDIRELT